MQEEARILGHSRQPFHRRQHPALFMAGHEIGADPVYIRLTKFLCENMSILQEMSYFFSHLPSALPIINLPRYRYN